MEEAVLMLIEEIRRITGLNIRAIHLTPNKGYLELNDHLEGTALFVIEGSRFMREKSCRPERGIGGCAVDIELAKLDSIEQICSILKLCSNTDCDYCEYQEAL